MFSPSLSENPLAQTRPTTEGAARIEGGGLVQVIVTSVSPLSYYLFVNDQIVPQSELESLSLTIETAPDGNPRNGIVRATLTRNAGSIGNEESSQQIPLFPCTLQVIALNRRLAVTCASPHTLEGLWLNLGLRPDGTSREVVGAKSLRLELTGSVLDAKLTWQDGTTEDIFPR